MKNEQGDKDRQGYFSGRPGPGRGHIKPLTEGEVEVLDASRKTIEGAICAAMARRGKKFFDELVRKSPVTAVQFLMNSAKMKNGSATTKADLIDQLEGAGVGSVYFIQATNSKAIKIGVSVDVKRRMTDLSAYSWEPLTLLGWISSSDMSEAEAHERFVKDRIKGEWFSPSDDLLGFIETSCKKGYPAPVIKLVFGDS